MKILVASSNRNKIKEIKEILKDLNIELVEPPYKIDVKETGTSFLENAYIKAKRYYEEFGLPTLAEDSGLVVNSIAPYPGIFSARFYSLEIYGKEIPTPSIDEANIRKLLRILKEKKDRTAEFKTVVVLLLSPDRGLWAEGSVKGKIAEEPRGKNGFGYDPVFIPEGFEKTFAEMSPQEKNRLSHRRKALENLKKLLTPLLS